jgi:hypothetical protein
MALFKNPLLHEAAQSQERSAGFWRNFSDARSVVERMDSTRAEPAWIRWSITLGAAFFIVALFVSAVFDPKIRVLHSLQALIYFAVIALTRRNSAWGYGAGCIISAFWNYVNLFVTTFIKAGVEQLLDLVQTGQLKRPDLALSLIAAGGNFLLIIACSIGFIRRSPRGPEWGQFVGGGVLAVGYFVAIIITTGPQYIGLLRRVFGL